MEAGKQYLRYFTIYFRQYYVTAGAVLIGVPIGICTAVFMAKFCPPKLYKFMKPAVELLAGIPSVVYGFFGMVVVVPFVRDFFGIQLGFGGDGSSMFTASVMLGIMILPTIISVGESAIRAVPESYYEGALALGATHERSVISYSIACSKIRRNGRCNFRYRKSNWRNYGGYYDCRKPAAYAKRSV